MTKTYTSEYSETKSLMRLKPPSGVTSTWQTTYMQLDWTDTSSVEDGFVLQRSDNGGTTWTHVALIPAGTVTYNDNAGESDYDYRLATYKGTLKSDWVVAT